MADIVQIRRDTAANWTSANPVLANGEQGYETDTKKMKIGDGSTTWTSLAYFAGGSGGSSTWIELTDTVSAIIANQLVIGNGAGNQLGFVNPNTLNVDKVDGKDATDLVLRDGTNSLTGNWNPDGNGTRKFGDATHKLAEIWAVDGIFGDLVFEERTCYICGKTFIDDDILSLIVIKTAKNGTHVVPVHISCIGGAN